MEDLTPIFDEEVRLKEYLVRIGDLINIEGPLLSLFSDVRNERLYLYDWVDSDESANRFLIYAVAPQKVLDYLGRKIGHRELFAQAVDERYYLADIRPPEFLKYKVIRLKEIPQEYRDIETNFFNEEFCRDVEKILLFVNRAQARSGNEYTLRISGQGIGRKGTTWILEFADYEMEQFSNLAKDILWEYNVPMVSSGQIRRPSDAEELYFNVLNLDIDDIREGNQLPERKGLELYRKP